MSKSPSQKSSHGDMQNFQNRKAHGSAKGLSRKSNRKPAKSKITTKMKSRAADSPLGADDEQSGDDAGDSSAIEEHKDHGEKPDAFALPGAEQQRSYGAAARLAGPDSEDEGNVSTDETQ